jgi:predicted ATPase/DNA-binding winged helix-turn-helix (wHTH) protein
LTDRLRKLRKVRKPLPRPPPSSALIGIALAEIAETSSLGALEQVDDGAHDIGTASCQLAVARRLCAGPQRPQIARFSGAGNRAWPRSAAPNEAPAVVSLAVVEENWVKTGVTPAPTPLDGHAISFGPFRLLAAQRLLLEGDKPVRLGSRAFDILAALVDRAGEVVTKEQLMARAWPQTFVEDANLKIQVSALRRALGDGQGGHRYIATVSGRGYNFVAPVRAEKPLLASPVAPAAPVPKHNLPFAVTRMIGREEAAAALVSRLSQQRLVTIVGPGGIGKTTLALAVAEQIVAGYEDGVWLVDLAPLGDPRLVPSAVATVLGLEIIENSLHSLVAKLRDRRMLLVLDSCEHVVEAAAGLAAVLLSGAPGVCILATSREPLRVAGEGEYRLGPLSGPQPSAGLTAAEVAAFPAVQLFVERVGAIVEDFALTDANAPAIAEICRRLDGLPLAIEFAAPRVEVLGVDDLAARLDDSLQLLGARRRTTVPRHRTMRAVVDWSYGLLADDEQEFLRSLGIFAGGFTVEAAAAVAPDAAKTRNNAINHLADLVTKSLVVVDASGAQPRFRLLDTTRAYTIEKLDSSGERERLARRHVVYYRNLFERAEGEAAARPTGEWLADYAWEIDNLRTALDWAFSPGGDGSTGVALTAAAVPLWTRLSLLEECRSRAKQALGALGTGGTRDPREEMKLHAALGASTPEGPELGEAFTKALDIAESLGDSEYQLRALRGLCFYHTGRNRFRAALPFAQKFHDLAARGADPGDQLFGERMMGVVKYFLGDQVGAQRHLEQVLTHYATADHGRDVIRFQIDSRLSARVFLARVLWLQGFSDQAVRTAAISVGEAQATGHANSFCYSLAWAACSIALWTGNLAAAARYTRMLLDCSREHSLTLWSGFGSKLQAVLGIKGGDLDTQDGGGCTPALTKSPSTTSAAGFMGELVEAFVRAGRIAEGLAVIEAGFGQSEAGWIAPELLRLRGELLLLQSAPAAAETAESLFRQALDEARRQQALSWELRAATSLARLLCQRGHRADAIACLEPIYGRFTEGFETADLMAAKRILDDTDHH